MADPRLVMACQLVMSEIPMLSAIMISCYVLDKTVLSSRVTYTLLTGETSAATT